MWPRFLFSLILFFSLSSSLFSQRPTLSELLRQHAARLQNGKEKPDTGTVNLLNAIAEIYIENVSDSSLPYSNRALKMAGQLKYPLGQARAYTDISKMQYINGNYDSSLSAILNSLQIFAVQNDNAGRGNACNMLGLNYLAQDKITSALDEFKKAVDINKGTGNKSRLSTNYFNFGLSYLKNNQMDSVFRYLNLSKMLSIEVNDQHMLAMANNRLGDYYTKLGQSDKAISFYTSVINNKNHQDDWENSFAFSGLAETYFSKGQYDTAVINGKQALLLAQKINTKWDIERALKILHESYRALGDYKNAYASLLKDKVYSDSLFNEGKGKEINALYLRQKNAENQILIKKNQIAQQTNNFNRIVIFVVVLITLFLVIISALTYRNSVKKSRLNQMLEKKSQDIAGKNQLIERQNAELLGLNKTKDQLFSIIGHDLRSPFAAILGAKELLSSGHLTQDQIHMLLNKFFDQVAVTSNMLDNLLLWANTQQDGFSGKFSTVSVHTIFKGVLEVFNSIAAEKKIKIFHQEDRQVLLWADPDQVRIIFTNIIANAIKFTPEKGLITISYLELNSTINVCIKDNGIGMPANKVAQLFEKSGKEISTYGTAKEKGIGIGLLLVKKFIDQNRARIYIQSKENEGTAFTLEFLKRETTV